MRKELFMKQKRVVEAEIQHMNRVLDMIKFKCWYYEQAIQDTNEQRLANLKEEDMPPYIRQAYINAHR